MLLVAVFVIWFEFSEHTCVEVCRLFVEFG
jgi:hypothetical protein